MKSNSPKAGPSRRKLAVVGAGIAGLAAARELTRSGFDVVVYEKARNAGGRIASLRLGSSLFDIGAQNIKPEGTALEQAAHEVLGADDLIEISAPVCLHDGTRISPPEAAPNAARKWTCRGGMPRLCEALAGGLQLQCGVELSAISEERDGVRLHHASGNETGLFDAVICAIPLPHAAALLSSASPGAASQTDSAAANRLSLVKSVQYTRCLSVALEYDFDFAAGWYALLAGDRSHPLLWLARENAKGAGFASGRTALVAQLGPAASEELWEASDDAAASRTAGLAAGLLGRDFGTPLHVAIHRWPHAQPVNPLDFDAANPPGARLIICGDGVSAARIPDAFTSGLHAAARLVSLGL